MVQQSLHELTSLDSYNQLGIVLEKLYESPIVKTSPDLLKQVHDIIEVCKILQTEFREVIEDTKAIQRELAELNEIM